MKQYFSQLYTNYLNFFIKIVVEFWPPDEQFNLKVYLIIYVAILKDLTSPRYSLDGAGGVFVPAAPINCKLCLEDATADKVTVISGCGCSFCTKVSEILCF